jgi:dihydrofolate synthase/folylpolyglutamate synthase
MDVSITHPAIARLLALGGELTPPKPGEPRRKFDLAHMRTLLRALGNPHLRFPSVLIAGTNGKGSTAATLASILQAAGHRTGLYTSPHLEQPNERIRIDGVAISDQTLAAHFTHIETVAAQLVSSAELPHTPSFFETITAIAFLHFAGADREESAGVQNGGKTPAEAVKMSGPAPDEAKTAINDNALSLGSPVDIAVLEVGLGGRLDATNVVEPLVSVLTDISLDHTEWLGTTLAEITREKAGILRPGGTLVTLPQHPEANQTIGEVAMPLAVHAVNAAEYLPPRTEARNPSGPEVRTTSLPELFRNRYTLSLPSDVFAGATLQVDSPLSGAHQQRNIALAIASAIALNRQHSFALTPEALERGIRDTDWPGRLQLLLPPPAHQDRAPILLDAAHNPAGAWALRAALSPLSIPGPRTLVFGCMADKAIPELAQVLFPVFDEVLLTQSTSPRAASVEQLAAAVERTGVPHRTFLYSATALDAALTDTPANGLIVLAGSIALLGELLLSLGGRS